MKLSTSVIRTLTVLALFAFTSPALQVQGSFGSLEDATNAPEKVLTLLSISCNSTVRCKL